jgi:ATP-dependent DNA helicase RecG
LKGVGPNRELPGKELGIHKYKDLINFIPTGLLTKTPLYKINELQKTMLLEVQINGNHQCQTVSSVKAENAWLLLL